MMRDNKKNIISRLVSELRSERNVVSATGHFLGFAIDLVLAAALFATHSILWPASDENRAVRMTDQVR